MATMAAGQDMVLAKEHGRFPVGTKLTLLANGNSVSGTIFATPAGAKDEAIMVTPDEIAAADGSIWVLTRHARCDELRVRVRRLLAEAGPRKERDLRKYEITYTAIRIGKERDMRLWSDRSEINQIEKSAKHSLAVLLREKTSFSKGKRNTGYNESWVCDLFELACEYLEKEYPSKKGSTGDSVHLAHYVCIECGMEFWRSVNAKLDRAVSFVEETPEGADSVKRKIVCSQCAPSALPASLTERQTAIAVAALAEVQSSEITYLCSKCGETWESASAWPYPTEGEWEDESGEGGIIVTCDACRAVPEEAASLTLGAAIIDAFVNTDEDRIIDLADAADETENELSDLAGAVEKALKHLGAAGELPASLVNARITLKRALRRLDLA